MFPHETNPQLIFRQEKQAAGTVFFLFGFWPAMGLFALNWRYPSCWGFSVAAGILLILSFGFASRWADYRALMICQRRGLLSYVRTREVLTRNLALARPGGYGPSISAERQNRKALIYAAWQVVIYVVGLAVVHFIWRLGPLPLYFYLFFFGPVLYSCKSAS